MLNAGWSAGWCYDEIKCDSDEETLKQATKHQAVCQYGHGELLRIDLFHQGDPVVGWLHNARDYDMVPCATSFVCNLQEIP